MAKNRIVIAQLDLDVNSATNQLKYLGNEITETNKSIQRLTAENKTTTVEFKNLQNQLTLYTKEHSNLTVHVNDLTSAMEARIEVQKGLDALIQKTNSSESEYLKNNEELLKQKKELNTADTDYQANLSLINTKILENNKWLQENGSAHAKLITTMSDYKQQVTESFDSINILNGGLAGFTSRSKEAGGGIALLKNGVGGMISGIKGMGAAVAANPLGILLMVIGPIIEQLKKFTPLTNAVEQAMAGLEPVLNLAMIPVKLLAEGITMLVEGFTKIIGSMSDTADGAIKLKQAEQDLATQMALQDVANEKAKQQMDELRKKSEDLTLTEEERLTALKAMAAVEKKNFDDRKKSADQAYANAAGNLKAAKDLSAEEMQILENGSDAQIKQLVKKKAISNEELGVLQKAQVAKMQFVTEEIDMKERQYTAVKGIVNGLIKKAQDQNLSEKDRVKALEDAAAMEKKILDERKKLSEAAYSKAIANAMQNKNLTQQDIADLKLGGAAYAEKMMAVKGFTQQEVDALKNAQAEKNHISKEETQMLQQQQAAQQKIRDDAKAKQQAAEQERKKADDERRQKAQDDLNNEVTRQKLELDLFVANQGIKAKTLQEELVLAEKVAQKKNDLAQAEFNTTKKTANDKRALDLANAQTANELAQARANAAVDNADRELQAYLKNQQEQIQSGAFMSKELLAQEQQRYTDMLAKQETFEKLKLDKGVINQVEYDAAIAKLKADNDTAQAGLLAQRKEAEKATEVIDLENKRINDTTNRDYDLKFQLDEYDAKRAIEREAAEKSGADLVAFDAATAQQRKGIEKSVMDNKLALANQTFGSMATLLGKESAAGKAMAVAQATIDTYKSAVSAYSAMSGIAIVGPALGAIAAAAAVAAGIANVKKITSTKAPKAAKGALFNIGGNRHSNGGTMFTGADGTQFEAEKGELIGVMNRNAAAHFMAFNNAFPAGGGSAAPNYFASGGIVSREMASPRLNIDELAAKIAAANAAIPAPVVAVQDIITQGNSYVQVRNAANF